MKKFLIAISILVFTPVAYCQVMYPTYTYRYKMTVEVDTPEGVKSGSSVIEITTQQWPEFLENATAGHTKSAKAKGEAVFVDLGERGILFTAFKGSYATRVYPEVYTGKSYGAQKSGGVPEYATKKTFNTNLTEKNYPMFVKFKDLNNPMSVFEIQASNFSKHLGEGVSLKRITVEATNTSPSFQIQNKLPWLKNLNGGYLHGGFSSIGAPLGLYGANFKLK